VYGLDVMLMQMVWQWCQQFRDGRTSVLDDVRPHTAAATVNHISTFGWELLDHAPYSPDLAPSDFHFFPALKRKLEGRRFTTNEDKTAVQTQDTNFHQQGFFKLVKQWDKCINIGGDYVDKKPTNAPFCPHRCVSRPRHFLHMADYGNLFYNYPTYELNLCSI
jgi:transposase